MLDDFRAPATRKLTYDLHSLTGVIFGMRTPPSDKARIVRLLRDKCAAANHKDLRFHQAYYSRASGRIERAPLDLC